MLIKRKLRTRRYNKRLSDAESVFATCCIPSEIISGPWAETTDVIMLFDRSANTLLITPVGGSINDDSR